MSTTHSRGTPLSGPPASRAMIQNDRNEPREDAAGRRRWRTVRQCPPNGADRIAETRQRQSEDRLPDVPVQSLLSYTYYRTQYHVSARLTARVGNERSSATRIGRPAGDASPPGGPAMDTASGAAEETPTAVRRGPYPRFPLCGARGPPEPPRSLPAPASNGSCRCRLRPCPGSAARRKQPPSTTSGDTRP